MAKHNTEWIQIPVAPNYEMDKHGRVRNIKTGQILKKQKAKDNSVRVCLIADSKRKAFSINNLLWLTHGRIKGKTTIPIPVIVSKGNERHFFDTARKAASFIAQRENYSPLSVRYYFRYRRREAHGWRISYQR